MKIVVIYGEDSLSSYKRFIHIIDEIQKRNWEHIELSSTGALSETLASGSLFSTDRLISARDASKIPLKEYSWLSTHSAEYEGRLLLYFSAALPAAIRKLLPKDTVFEEFKLKKELFSFLETIAPGSGNRLVSQFHAILDSDPAELILAMLSRQVRDLSWVKSGATNFAAPPWRKQKLLRQAQKFSWEQLKKLVSDLSIADIKSKSGEGELTLLLDLVFIKL